MKPSLAFSGTLLLLAPLRAQDPVFDDFERHVLGPSWTTYSSPAGIVNQSDLGSATGNWCVGSWTASVFAADQFSEAELSSDIPAAMLTQVFVRRRASDLARYGFHWNGDPGNSRWEIKYDGVPSAQTVILASVDAPGPLPGDRIRIEALGTDPVMLRGFHDGVLKLVGIDSSPQRIVATGPAGVVSRPKQGTSPVAPVAIFESWSGGSLPVATVYCTAQVNSLGCLSAIGFTGVPSASAGAGFTVTAANVLSGRPGLLFYGTAPASTPLGGGTLCAGGALRRTPVQLAGGSATLDCSGSYAFDFNAWIASGADPALVPGAEVFAQYYARDPGLPPPGNTHLTDALRFTVRP